MASSDGVPAEAPGWARRRGPEDLERYWRATERRDHRYDGHFYVAVVTTGIYCRPGCRATAAKKANVRFYPTVAAVRAAGFRACKRCDPDRTDAYS